jgi:antitoxin Phd
MRGGTVKELQLEDAKATLSAAVDRAVAGEPTVITRHGRKEAVLVSFEEWERLSKAPSFADLLLAFPGEPGDIPERPHKPVRALCNTVVSSLVSARY